MGHVASPVRDGSGRNREKDCYGSTRKIQPRPAPHQRQALALSARDIGVQEFLYGDQFEFLSSATKGASVTAPAVTGHSQTPREPARKAG